MSVLPCSRRVLRRLQAALPAVSSILFSYLLPALPAIAQTGTLPAGLNLSDPQLIARGSALFAQSCSVGYCHGVAGKAGRGPRLRGREWDKNYLFKVTSEGIPNSDVFVKDVKILNGPTRSAYVLNVSYVPVQVSGLPEYQATKAFVLFNCAERSYEYRSVERYANMEGSGSPSSSDIRKADSPPMELKGAELLSMEKTLLENVCSAKM